MPDDGVCPILSRAIFGQGGQWSVLLVRPPSLGTYLCGRNGNRGLDFRQPAQMMGFPPVTATIVPDT